MHWTVEIDCGFISETTIYVTKNEVQYRIIISSNFKERIVAIADRISLLKLKADLKFSEVEASFLICRKIRFFMMLRRYYVALYTQSKFPKISILLHMIFLI
jgi:hypothetical protein